MDTSYYSGCKVGNLVTGPTGDTQLELSSDSVSNCRIIFCAEAEAQQRHSVSANDPEFGFSHRLDIDPVPDQLRLHEAIDIRWKSVFR